MKPKKFFWFAVIAAAGYAAFLNKTSSYKFVQKDAEFFNQSYSYGLEQFKQACEGMSRWSYFAGTGDGTIQIPIPRGKTYYYKSRCYMELAQKEMSQELCSKVVKRISLLYDGSDVSEDNCLKEVQKLTKMDKAQQLSSKKIQEIKVRAFKIESLIVEHKPSGRWNLKITIAGQLPGAYRLELMNGAATFSDSKRIFSREEISLGNGPSTTITRTVQSSQLTACKGCELSPRRIYPIAASLTLLRSQDSHEVSHPLLINIVNTTITNH